MKCSLVSKSSIIHSFSQLFISILVLKTFIVIGEDEFNTDNLWDEMEKRVKGAKHDKELMDLLLYPTFPPSIKLPYIGQRMVDFKIIPRYMPLPPNEICNVTYPKKLFIEPGMDVEARQVKDKPKVTWHCDPKKLYTLSLHNIDGPIKFELPWLVINIPGNDISKGETIKDHGPPSIKIGRNRHVFLVFEQKNHINKSLMHDDNNIHYVFHMRSIATSYELGHPKAGNFFCLPLNYTNEMDFFGQIY